MRVWTKNQVGSFNIFPFLVDFLFGVVGDKSKREEEKGGGRRVDARRCWLSGQEQQEAGAGAGGRTLVVGRKDGTDPRSAASNIAVNLVLLLLNFLYDRVGIRQDPHLLRNHQVGMKSYV